MQIPKNPRFYINLGEYIEYVYPEHLLTKEEIISTPNIEDNYFHSEDVSDLFSVVNHRTIPSMLMVRNLTMLFQVGAKTLLLLLF